ncbi:MAG TPA: hypothetical protein ENN77_01730 [Candidatus Wirthbacteria bacterium]|nr:hypothetical protein [Candidatus Wirthbacteria bacterium]
MIEIISPEQPTFVPAQSRPWKASIKVDNDYWNRFDYPQFEYECDWIFILNNKPYEEYLITNGFYDEQTNGKTCGFTSPFIKEAGELKAQVTLNIFDSENLFDADGNYLEEEKTLIDSITATREYTVQPYQ